MSGNCCTLNSLSIVAPEWVQMQCPMEWVDRYGPWVDDFHLPTKKEERQAYAEVIGADGHALLAAIYTPEAPRWLRHIPAVETLRRVWVQQYYLESGRVHWRTEKEGIPPSSLLSVPLMTLKPTMPRRRQPHGSGIRSM
jgi:transposase